jgi:hypothetical protein
MRRATAFLGLALLAAGCSGGKDGKPTAEAPADRPGPDEARACIVAYLNQCGWRDVELTQIADQAKVPDAARAAGDAWAYSFTARYTSVVGERQTSANWVAVVTRADGKPCVSCCFDEGSRLVGGHSGTELPAAEKGDLTALAAGPAPAELPPIVAPKP